MSETMGFDGTLLLNRDVVRGAANVIAADMAADLQRHLELDGLSEVLALDRRGVVAQDEARLAAIRLASYESSGLFQEDSYERGVQVDAEVQRLMHEVGAMYILSATSLRKRRIGRALGGFSTLSTHVSHWRADYKDRFMQAHYAGLTHDHFTEVEHE
ncbi:hypothetical protein KC973_01965 [Candidatus Saccharibacteria bacterium]|nr:hypothetical protein [Candidatus Saccharibacteria bacterium]